MQKFVGVVVQDTDDSSRFGSMSSSDAHPLPSQVKAFPSLSTAVQSEPEMHDTVVTQLALRADLKAAIAADELTLAYQPIFDLETDEIAGCEALLRWEHAVRGSVSPATFIPVAEDSGLILPLGRWVLERACDTRGHPSKLLGPRRTRGPE